MEKVVLVRFGEIFLKGKNRGYFEKTLLGNIRNLVDKFGAVVNKIPGRYEVSEYDEDDEYDILETLKKIPGIFSFSPAVRFETNLDSAIELANEFMKDLSGTFKVETNRADKTFLCFICSHIIFLPKRLEKLF